MNNPEHAQDTKPQAEEGLRDATLIAILQKVANFGDPRASHTAETALSPLEAAAQIQDHYLDLIDQAFADEVHIEPRLVSADDEEPLLFTDPPRNVGVPPL